MANWDSGDEDGFPANRFGGPLRRDRDRQPPQGGGWSAAQARFQSGGRSHARRGGPYGGGGDGNSDDDSARPNFNSGRGSSWGATGRGGRGGGRFGRDSRAKDDDDDERDEDEDEDDDRFDYIALGTPVELPSTMTATGAAANEPVKRKAPWQQEVGAPVVHLQA